MACSRRPLIIGAPQVRHPGAHTMLIKGLSGRLAMGAPRASLVKEPGALFVKTNFKPYPGQLGVRLGQAEDFVGPPGPATIISLVGASPVSPRARLRTVKNP